MPERHLKGVRAYRPTPKDSRLEEAIQAAHDAYNHTNNRVMKRALWREISRLHAMRSPGMVAHMEREKGLR